MPALRNGLEIGPFVVDQILPQGKGGMAQVCLAHETRDSRVKVAIKIARVDGGAGERNINALRGETEILRTLNHPNIVRIIKLPLEKKNVHFMACSVELPGMPWYYAMEYLEGKTLSTVIKIAKKGLPEPIVITVGIKMASVLDHLHRLPRPLAYLDMKPENIVFRYSLDGRNTIEPVLIDFGTVTGFKDVQVDRYSLIFSAPERIDQIEQSKPLEMPVDLTKVDVYALGVVLYEALTGKLPFGGITQKGLTTAIKNHAMVPLQSARSGAPISSVLATFVEKMISRNPSDRPSAGDVITELTRMERQIR